MEALGSQIQRTILRVIGAAVFAGAAIGAVVALGGDVLVRRHRSHR